MYQEEALRLLLHMFVLLLPAFAVFAFLVPSKQSTVG